MSGAIWSSARFERSGLSGAVISGTTLAIVTLRPTDAGFVLYPPRTEWFDAEDTGQEGMRKIKLEIDSFFFRSGIRELVTRALSPGGKFMAAATAYKIEGLLQLLPIPLASIPAASIAAWLKSDPPGLPDPDSTLPRHRQELQQRAIETVGCAFDRLASRGEARTAASSASPSIARKRFVVSRPPQPTVRQQKKG